MLPTSKENLEKLNNISNNEYYLYQKADKSYFPIILEIKGNINTPYEGGVFIIEINSNKIQFITKICSIFINIENGEFKDQNLIKLNLESIINYIKNEILISPNTTEIIENELKDWPGKETYFKFLSTIKSYTQKYANKDGIKIKVDNNLLSNNDFSKYTNNKEFNTKKSLKRIRNEFKRELELISEAKTSLGINIENIYFCPFNNFNQVYFEFLGLPGTPYEGGVFPFLVEIPNDYPFRYPKCIFRTKIYHNKFNENTSEICDNEFHNFGIPTLYYICLYYYKMMNKYDYICFCNKEARYLIYNNFKEYLNKVKFYTKKYANLDGIKFKADLDLIENSLDNIKIEQPVEKDFMPKIEKIYDDSIKEEEINIIFSRFNIFSKNKIEILLKIKNTEFVVDICLKLREYIIKYKDSIADEKSPENRLSDYKNLLPYLIKPKMEYNRQIGYYGIKNNDKIIYTIGIPTCSTCYDNAKN